MINRVEFGHTHNFERRRADSLDARAHSHEHVAQIDDFGFARRVVDHGRACCQYACHQHVLGGPDAGKVEPNLMTGQSPGRRSYEETVFDADLRSKPFETGDVHVETARSDVVATGKGDIGLPAAGQQRAQHADRRAHTANEVVVGLMGGLTGHIDHQQAAAHIMVDLAAESAQQFTHDFDVENGRNVA